MKTLKLFPLALMSFLLMFGCETSLIEDSVRGESFTESISEKMVKPVKKPLKARLFTSQADDALTQMCSFTSPMDFWGLEHQIGHGNSTLLGNFTTDIYMCFHIVVNDQGIPDLQNGFGEFNQVEGTMQAANGDKIYFVTPGGKLEPIQDDTYMFKFVDYCTITGGTGRFENVSGEFVSNGLVRMDGTGIDHVWEGHVIFNKDAS